jgi:cyclophilin family peptidyl-prolyl cis-trans isomerase
MKKLIFTCLMLGLSSLALAANPQVEIKTSQGSIVIEVFADKAPKSSANFLRYVREDFYKGTIFHRVIANFMIQGGGFTPDMKEKLTRGPIENEAPEASLRGLKNTYGTVAMARTSDPHSATAQFFINVKDNANLDYPGADGWGYAVFGKVVKGMDVVMAIRNVPTGNAGMHQNVPTTPVIIESAVLLDDKSTAKPKADAKTPTGPADKK